MAVAPLARPPPWTLQQKAEILVRTYCKCLWDPEQSDSIDSFYHKNSSIINIDGKFTEEADNKSEINALMKKLKIQSVEIDRVTCFDSLNGRFMVVVTGRASTAKVELHPIPTIRKRNFVQYFFIAPRTPPIPVLATIPPQWRSILVSELAAVVAAAAHNSSSFNPQLIIPNPQPEASEENNVPPQMVLASEEENVPPTQPVVALDQENVPPPPPAEENVPPAVASEESVPPPQPALSSEENVPPPQESVPVPVPVTVTAQENVVVAAVNVPDEEHVPAQENVVVDAVNVPDEEHVPVQAPVVAEEENVPPPAAPVVALEENVPPPVPYEEEFPGLRESNPFGVRARRRGRNY